MRYKIFFALLTELLITETINYKYINALRREAISVILCNFRTDLICTI